MARPRKVSNTSDQQDLKKLTLVTLPPKILDDKGNLIDDHLVHYVDLLTIPQLEAIHCLAKANFNLSNQKRSAIVRAAQAAKVTFKIIKQWLDDPIFLDALESRLEYINEFIFDRLVNFSKKNSALSLTAINSLKDNYNPESNIKSALQRQAQEFEIKLAELKNQQTAELLKTLPNITFHCGTQELDLIAEVLDQGKKRGPKPKVIDKFIN